MKPALRLVATDHRGRIWWQVQQKLPGKHLHNSTHWCENPGQAIREAVQLPCFFGWPPPHRNSIGMP